MGARERERVKTLGRRDFTHIAAFPGPVNPRRRRIRCSGCGGLTGSQRRILSVHFSPDKRRKSFARAIEREREREKEAFSRVLFSGRVGNAGGVGFQRCRQPETERRRPVPVAIRPLCCWCCVPRLFLTFLPK